MCISRSSSSSQGAKHRVLTTMYPTGEQTMNYYVPIETSHITTANTVASNVSSRPALYILGRRYALTSTGYKYVEIGIRVGPAPCVEIFLGDTHNHQLTLSHQTWKDLMNRRTDIEHLLQSTETSPLWIQDLSIAMVKFQNKNVLKLTMLNTSLYLKRETLDKLFDLEICIDNVYSWLCDKKYIVTARFAKFVDILIQKNFIKACYSLKTIDWGYASQALRDSDDFDCNSLIDCELVSYALSEIIHVALRD